METWIKWILGIFFGGSLIIAIAWGVLILSGEPEQAEELRNIPNQLEEARQNVTDELINAGTEAIKETEEGIIPAFSQAGKDMAKDINDPGTKKTIEVGGAFLGVLIWLMIVIAIITAIFNAIGVKVKGINA